MTKRNTKKLPAPDPLLTAKEIGHWKYGKNFRISEWFGFVYCITRKSDGKFYIGKKQFKVQGLKRSKNYGKEHKWRTYTGSSTHLNADIKKLGKAAFDFEIIDLYRTKGGLYYAEAHLQMVSEALPLRLDDGEFAAYNAVIPAIKFIPHEQVTTKTKRFPAKIKRRIKECKKTQSGQP